MLIGLMPSSEPFPAASVLKELDSDTGLVIWLSLRAVDLWIGTDAGRRSRLFAAEAERVRGARIEALGPLECPLGDALRVLAGILSAPAVDPAQVATACAALARWADAGGWAHTAFEAASRAALASPRASEYAMLAGTMARRIADYARAAAWMARAVRLARRAGDGAGHANALLAKAHIHLARGERHPSESALHAALRSARRHGVWEVKPRAYHELFCIQSTDGDVRTAAAFALAAAEGYGLHHELLSALAHDVALFLATRGRGRQVLPLMEVLAPRTRETRLRLVAYSSLGRVAGGAGDRARFAEAWTTVWRMLDERVSEARAAEALINLAFGAAELRDWARVELAAREALRIAAPRQEWQEIAAAEKLLAALAEARVPDPPPMASGTDEDLKDALAAAEHLLRQLQQTPAVMASLSPTWATTPESPSRVPPVEGHPQLARRLPTERTGAPRARHRNASGPTA